MYLVSQSEDIVVNMNWLYTNRSNAYDEWQIVHVANGSCGREDVLAIYKKEKSMKDEFKSAIEAAKFNILIFKFRDDV